MSNTMRWRYGDTNPVMMPVASQTIIEIGDLLYANNGLALPASDLANQGTTAATQEAFHDKFLGVAMQCSPAGSTHPIRVATTGVFEFDCTLSTFELGALLSGYDSGTGTLAAQIVDDVATPNLAIGRCVKRVSPAATKVLVDVVSTIIKGGPQAAA
jgi:hypothetical protein